MKRVLMTLMMAMLMATTAAAADDTKPKAPKAPKVTVELVTKGRASFEAACVACHGTNGDGSGPAGQYLNPKPRAFGKDPFKQGDSVEAIFMTLQSGVKDTPMVSFGHLPEDERWALAHYVSSFLSTKDGKKAKKLVDALPPLTPPAAPAPTPVAAPTTP